VTQRAFELNKMLMGLTRAEGREISCPAGSSSYQSKPKEGIEVGAAEVEAKEPKTAADKLDTDRAGAAGSVAADADGGSALLKPNLDLFAAPSDQKRAPKNRFREVVRNVQAMRFVIKKVLRDSDIKQEVLEHMSQDEVERLVRQDVTPLIARWVFEETRPKEQNQYLNLGGYTDQTVGARFSETSVMRVRLQDRALTPYIHTRIRSLYASSHTPADLQQHGYTVCVPPDSAACDR
jgi:hypothetical protein